MRWPFSAPPAITRARSEAMGFCLLNNVAVAAAHARARGLERILILDWDVHHGNGTQEMFVSDPHVLYVSLHQWPFYPGTGDADRNGRRRRDGATRSTFPFPGALATTSTAQPSTA